jgi:CubicO group peptidase (beta-lactamase class C family)
VPQDSTSPNYQAMQLGALSIANYLRLSGVLHMPLEFEPGSSYHYSNPGYSIVGYIIEQVRTSLL